MVAPVAQPVVRRAFPFLPDRESLLGKSLLSLAGVVRHVEPSRFVLRQQIRRRPTANIIVTCAYRSKYADLVQAMITGSPAPARWILWAVDDVDPRLKDLTVGQGRGPKLELHQEMFAKGLHDDKPSPVPNERPYWAIADDDLRLRRRTFTDLAAAAAIAELDVFAPSHSWVSHWSHLVTLQRPLSLVRSTHFVEIGPILVLSPKAQDLLLPFPAGMPGDWGLEAYWSSLHRPELRCGLVDAITMDHLVPMGRHYDSAAAWKHAQEWVKSLGIEDFAADQRAMTVTLGTWRPWKLRPSWTSPENRS